MYFLYICSAILPVAIILIYIYKRDKFPEPKGVVFVTFILGCSTVLAIDYIIPVLDNFGEKNLRGETLYFYDSFIRAAFLEEFFKFLVLVFYCARHDEFDEPMDAVIYGVAVSLGFATIENIDYVLKYYKEPSFTMAIVRAFSAVPLHAFCGVLMGFLITLSIFEKNHNKINILLALMIPSMFHGLYNYSLTSNVISNYIAEIVLLVLIIRTFYVFKDLKKRQTKNESHVKHYLIGIREVSITSTLVLGILIIMNVGISLIA